NGDVLRHRLLKHDFNYEMVSKLSKGTFEASMKTPRNQLQPGDVLILGQGGGGHTVWVEGPDSFSHLLQAGSYLGTYHDGGKPIPLSMVVALEKHYGYNKKSTPDRFLPNVRYQQHHS